MGSPVYKRLLEKDRLLLKHFYFDSLRSAVPDASSRRHYRYSLLPAASLYYCVISCFFLPVIWMFVGVLWFKVSVHDPKVSLLCYILRYV